MGIPDLTVWAVYMQQEAHGRFSEQEAIEKLHGKFAGASIAQLEDAVRQAGHLHQVAVRCDVYDEPSIAAATKAAKAYLRKHAPGLSEEAYSAALHPILYSWMK